MFYLAIENKSVKTKSTNKLYFSQHFSVSDGGHQVERISDFVDRSGRKGFLAVEFKRGVGRPRKAFLVPWKDVRDRYQDGQAGFHLDEIKEYPEVLRDSQDYSIAELCQQMAI
jgi:Holliday junction resolvase